jgi:hypothetical protein
MILAQHVLQLDKIFNSHGVERSMPLKCITSYIRGKGHTSFKKRKEKRHIIESNVTNVDE